ncbi:NfeD family protein [Roseimaritima sediminicola]|uniref:NfeD family protein n=1 Tax=Roseimaritima sediminicola TaxID=2662066 RepID=UPI00129852BD|nr:NfeD family protein [Roseimaritima sediminicola]
MLRLLCGWMLVTVGLVIVGPVTVDLVTVDLVKADLGLRVSGKAFAQDAAAEEPAASEAKRGYLIEVPLPITADSSQAIVATLKSLAEKTSGAGRRQAVILQFGDPDRPGDGQGTELENSQRLARAIGSPELRSLRMVAFLRGPVRGHAVLTVLACDQVIVTSDAQLGDAGLDEPAFDETVAVMYESIAGRRGIFPKPLVRAMLDPDMELARVTQVDGSEVFVGGQQLAEIRDQGQNLQEEQISTVGQTVLLGSDQLRAARLASHRVASARQAADVLDIAELAEPEAVKQVSVESGTLIELNGNMTGAKIRRLEANLAAPQSQEAGGAWVVAIDSPGGSLNDSMRLASTLSIVPNEGRVAAGWVGNEALGDAVLVAAACRPLLVSAEARLGGPGAQNLSSDQVRQLREAIQQVAGDAGRPAALLEGLLDSQLVVYRYTDTKTGRVRYATERQIEWEVQQEQAPSERWSQGARMDLADGLSGAEAVELGLADGLADSLEDVKAAIGLQQPLKRVSDRPVIRAVEWLGNRPFLPMLLLLIAFMTFSMEISAPGLGVPGFISMLCFGLFFWMSFLAGTAEWLEVLAFTLGVIFILIEIFVVPGAGVFGLGGLLLLVGGVVLTSQTFVIPQNPYQYAKTTETLWTVIVACGGLLGGFLLLRLLLPNTKLFGYLHLATPDAEIVEQREQLVDYHHLLGAVGTAITPLRPAGKARIGDEVFAVVSDGTAIGDGEAIRVFEVHGNRIVVESAAESEG